MVQPYRPHMAIRHMYIACWITKATDTYSEYVIFFAFPDNSGYANAPQCYVLYIDCLSHLISPYPSVHYRTIFYSDEKNLSVTSSERVIKFVHITVTCKTNAAGKVFRKISYLC